jgi:predicted membrane-bound spermidine synthase
MILLLFFCSGATALIYEVVWSKYLALMLGSTVQAQTVVLAVFMGGLALGNRLFGSRADASQQPLALYGKLELAIGLYAFFFGAVYKLADAIFIAVGSRLLEQGALLLALKATLCVALLLGPTILMGGTLPVLAAWLQRSTADASRRSARFYSVNSLGAVAGSFMAGFVLVRELGLTSTLQLTALANVVIGFTAIGLSRKKPLGEPGTGEQAGSLQPTASDKRATDASATVGCLVVALTGAVSMGLEVLASRSLTLIFGASLQAFAIVLMAFILGIGVGSAVIASPRWRHSRREPASVLLLLAAAGVVGLNVAAIEPWVDFYRVMRSGLASSAVGYALHQLLAAAMSLAVLGLPAGCIGAVLPLWIRGLSAEGSTLGGQVGRLLTWNTVGAVGGSLLTGFVLMPLLGLRGAFNLLAFALCVTAFWIAQRSTLPRWTKAAGTVAALLALSGTLGGEGWRHVLSSGVFRARETEFQADVMTQRKQHVKILFYQDAADATVSVEQGDGVLSTPQLSLRINGKTDATTEGDLSTQYLLGHLPFLARPESKNVFILGFGSGITAGAVLGHPINQLVIAENCAPVLRAAKLFEKWNRGVLTNKFTRVFNEDARTALKLSPQHYDAIISEPSNPWMAGVGSVFSREFYELCASRLKDAGIMTQWFHVYEMHDGIVTLVLSTFTSVFPHVEIWDPGTGDIILLGSQRPWRSGPEVFREVFAREQPRRDLEEIGLKSPEAVWARQLASQRTAFAIADGDGVQSDEFPVLEYEAPRAFFLGRTARLLFQFDERTRQAEIAPPEKRAALSALGGDAVRHVFERFSSVNSDLPRQLALRLSGGNSAATTLDGGQLPQPSIFFSTTGSETNGAPVTVGASDTMKTLLRAESRIASNSPQWADGVDCVEAALRDAKSETKNNDWSPARFAALAGRSCLAHGELARANDLLSLGLKLEPTAELRYLSRILEREQHKK